MHFVGPDEQSLYRFTGTDDDAPFFGFSVQDADRAGDDVVQVELLPVDLASLLQQCSQLGNDIAGALIVFADIDENLLNELQIRCLPLEYGFRGFCVAADGAQRLVQIMCDRCRQRACGRGLIHMHQFEETQARFPLRGKAAPTLDQLPGDDDALQRDHGEHAEDRLPMFFPYGLFLEAQDGSGRKGVLGQPQRFSCLASAK